MPPVDTILPRPTTASDSLLKTIATTSAYNVPSYYTEYESMVYRLRLSEEEAVRWRSLAQQLQQDGALIVAKEGKAQLALSITKADYEKQGQLLKSTDAQLVTVRDDLRRLIDASQRKEEALNSDVTRLKAELAVTRTENERLKLQLDASQGTSTQRGELLTYRDKEVLQVRAELDASLAESAKLRNELTISRADCERLKAALESETSASNQRAELLAFRASEVKALKADLDVATSYARKTETELAVTERNLQTTGEVLNARNAEYAKMQVDLTETQRTELSQRFKVARLEQDASFWSNAYLDALRKPQPLVPTPPSYAASISRSKLLDAKAKAALYGR